MSEHAQPAHPSVTGTHGAGVEAVSAANVPWKATWVLLLCGAAVVNGFLVAGVHGARGFFLAVLVVAVCSLAALFDGWTQRIPNPLTYTAILLGLGLNGMRPLLEMMHAQAGVTWLGSAGPAASLGGFAMCAGLGLAAALLAGVHGGDLKLLAAVGALAGFDAMWNIALLALLLALVYAAINLAVLGRLTLVLHVAAQRMLELFYLRKFQTPIPGAGKASQIPMAIPLAVAAILSVVMQVRYGAWRML